MYSYNPYYGKYLAHYGVLGMKWGVRKDRNMKTANKKLKSVNKAYTKALKAERSFNKKSRNNSIFRNFAGAKAHRLYRIFNTKMDDLSNYINGSGIVATKNWDTMLYSLKNVGKPDANFQEKRHSGYTFFEKKSNNGEFTIGYDSDDAAKVGHKKMKMYADSFEKNYAKEIKPKSENAVYDELQFSTDDPKNVALKNTKLDSVGINSDGTYDLIYFSDKYIGDHIMTITTDKHGTVLSRSTDG